METEPVLTVTAISVAIVSALNLAGVVVDLTLVQNVVTVLVALVVAGIARSKVTPVA